MTAETQGEAQLLLNGRPVGTVHGFRFSLDRPAPPPIDTSGFKFVSPVVAGAWEMMWRRPAGGAAVVARVEATAEDTPRTVIAKLAAALDEARMPLW